MPLPRFRYSKLSNFQKGRRPSRARPSPTSPRPPRTSRPHQPPHPRHHLPVRIRHHGLRRSARLLHQSPGHPDLDRIWPRPGPGHGLAQRPHPRHPLLRAGGRGERLRTGEEPVVGSRSFTTQAANFESKLGDGRVWELVTPTRKFGGVMTNGVLVQADPNGRASPSRPAARSSKTRKETAPWKPPRRSPEGARRAAGARATWSPATPKRAALASGRNSKCSAPISERPCWSPATTPRCLRKPPNAAPTCGPNTEPPVYRPLVTTKEPFANVPPGTVFGGEVNGARSPVLISGADPSLSTSLSPRKRPWSPERRNAASTSGATGRSRR